MVVPLGPVEVEGCCPVEVEGCCPVEVEGCCPVEVEGCCPVEVEGCCPHYYLVPCCSIPLLAAVVLHVLLPCRLHRTQKE